MSNSHNLDSEIESLLPQRVNSGPWVHAYTLYRLREIAANHRIVLPICSLNSTAAQVVRDPQALYLPPLYMEVTENDPELLDALVAQILNCFPVHGEYNNNRMIVEVETTPAAPSSPPPAPLSGRIVTFSVDTAVEEHGPHLPLGTDTIQSYGVLRALCQKQDAVHVARPLDYGQLTWGLPFGFSVDLTAPLVTRYVAGYVDALTRLHSVNAVYVVDVHGSITHRQAIVDGLNKSQCERWAFRWLHEPLAEFASARGDQHAGGVETALVEEVNPDLIDADWFPTRESDIVAGCMTLEKAVELTPDLTAFRDFAETNCANGIVGDIRNYHTLDANLMFTRMVDLAVADVENLSSDARLEGNAGQNLW